MPPHTKAKVLTWTFFIMDLVIAVSMFAAPATLEPGTVKELDGNANRIDYDWSHLPPYQRAVYWWGDLQCHQKAYRSFTLHGNQMPQCARCIGIYVGSTLGLGAALLIPVGASYLETLTYLLPAGLRERSARARTLALVAFAGILILPTALDGSIQLVTSYESNNVMRVVSGGFAGFGAGLFYGAFLSTAVGIIIQQPGPLADRAIPSDRSPGRPDRADCEAPPMNAETARRRPGPKRPSERGRAP